MGREKGWEWEMPTRPGLTVDNEWGPSEQWQVRDGRV